MKTPLVSELNSEQNVTTFFLVCEKEIRNTREGKPYLRLELGDRSGTIEARMWDQFESAAKGINRDDFVKVQGRVEIYRNRPQLAVLQVRLEIGRASCRERVEWAVVEVAVEGGDENE